jgi:hypothetical protein
LKELQVAEATEAKKRNQWPRQAKGGGKKTCGAGECKRPYRAKGYCFFHYKKWRQGELPHSRYRTCSKAECRKPVEKGGLCAQHYAEAFKKTDVESAAATPAAPAA